MRVYTQSEKSLLETQRASEAAPAPDRVTPSGKRISYTGADKDKGAGIYLVGAMGAGLVKIGWVRKLERIDERINRLQIDCPYPVMLLLTVPAARTDEGRVHKHFDHLHFHGEWFRCAGDLESLVNLAGSDVEAAQDILRGVFTVRFGGG